MALNRLQVFLNEKLSDAPKMSQKTLMGHIKSFIAEEQKTYETNKENGCLTFGKHRGFKIDDLVTNETGKSYLLWLVRQTWMTQEKFPDLMDAMAKHGITKRN